MGPQTGREIPPLSHVGAAVELHDNHVFAVFVPYLFHWGFGSRRKHLPDTFNYHWEGRRTLIFQKESVCWLTSSCLYSGCRDHFSWCSQLPDTCSLWTLGSLWAKGQHHYPTFHKRKHKPRCAKGLSDLVYQLLGDRVELASELSDLQFIRIKLRSNVRGEMLPVGISSNVHEKRRAFAFITSSTTAENILGLRGYVRINNKRNQGVDHLPLVMDP